MPSIVSAYEYDIFISYRHNDNRSGWVTEFVNALQEELAATIKEPLCIYFDKNPHDGLLETHNVDKSLEGKLKCLIFIPIISQTYCDPKSFAWQHEFVAFNKLAQEDTLGRDIKLGNGNVASRILPIKIHDLDAEDKSTIENEINGVLRAIEFIYKSGGVNRPLNSKDDEVRTHGKILYRDQVNKVANAVKEIVQTMKSPVSKAPIKGNQESSQGNGIKKNFRKRVAGIGLGLMILLALVYGVSQYVSGPVETEQLDKSIAVLPFADMSQNKDQEYLGDGIAEEILNVLAKVKDVKVIGRTSSFAYKGKAIDLKTIGRELGVSTVLEGSIRKDGNRIRVTAQFIRTEDGFHLWSESYDRDLKDIFQIQDDLAKSITRSLLSSFNTSTIQPSAGKDQVNDKAYELYLLGKHYASKRGMDNFYKAIDLFDQSLALDNQFVEAYAELAKTYSIIGFVSGTLEINDVWELAEKNAKKALTLDGNNSLALAQMGYIQRNQYWNWEESKKYYQKSLASAPNGEAHGLYSLLLSALNEKDSSLYHARKALELNPTSNARKTGMARVLYYNRNYVASLDQIESMAMSTLESRSTRLGVLFYLDKGKALEAILESSSIDKTIQEQLKMIYLKDGWEVVLKEIASSYLTQIHEDEKSFVTFYGSSKEDKLNGLAERAESKDGSIVYLLAEPRYDPLRSEPEFEELLKKMGLDKYKKE